MVADSLCVTSWRARPASFVGLMTLYESNYVRLRGLAGDLRGLAGATCRACRRDCDLHLDAVEHSPYTTVFRLTYFFDDAPGTVADPELEVRVYHDARLAEAGRCGRWVRHPGLGAIRSRRVRVARRALAAQHAAEQVARLLRRAGATASRRGPREGGGIVHEPA